jgi:hypothetical protein
MSLKANQPSVSGGVQSAFKRLDPAKYTSLGDFIDEVNRPDIREALAKTYGDQGITGFLQMTGAIKSAGTADKVQWWEEARLHARQTGDWIAGGKIAVTVADEKIFTRVNDVLLIGTTRFLVTDVAEVGSPVTSRNLTVVNMGGTAANPISGAVDAAIIGNLYGQGSSQPTEYLESNVVLRENPYSILKETFKVTGSQATNIGYINLGNGDYRWYIKGEMDTRQRFLDKREMMMLLGQKKATDVTIGDYSVNGSEGYFAAIEDRGIVETGGVVNSLTEIDAIIAELDKQGAAPEYCIYGNTAQMLAIDDMVASLNGAAGFSSVVGTGASTVGGVTSGAMAFGAFQNAEQAVKLGFKSFGRGGYTFHNKSWKLLNDPTLLGGSNFKGVMIPMTSVIDPKSGARAAALEMNYKAVDGYSREMEHWMTGSILGVTNTNDDSLQFNYRSECNLVTRAANQHILIRS